MNTPENIPPANSDSPAPIQTPPWQSPNAAPPPAIASESETQIAPTNTSDSSNEIMPGATHAVQVLAQKIRREMAKAVVGQDDIVTQFLIALLANGHVLLEGVPGVAKTLAARTMARTISGQFKRIQFTPDLMPSDVLGTNVFDARTTEFSLRPGPIFTDILLADEINRTPPKTQAALLEAMQEHRVTIDGVTHQLPSLFQVFATQNPIDYEGTYPLPEAQLDRFLLKVLITYPTLDNEIALLQRVHEGFDASDLESAGVQAVADAASIQAARQAVKNVTVSEGILRYIAQIVTRTRGLPTLTLGAGPRAGIALLESSKAFAALSGRDYVRPEDIKTVALPVLRHRLILRAEAEMENLRADDVVRSVIDSVEVPR